MRNIKGIAIVILSVFILTGLLSGCEPLRKKFVRKKKRLQKEEFIPVLDPIDYPQSRVSPQEKYAYHFSMWQVWSKDIQNLMKEDSMDKRKKYLVSQMIVQLQELQRWTPENYLEALGKAIKDYENILTELEKPEIMRNDSIIGNQLRRTDSYLRNELDPDKVFVEAS